MCLSVVKLAGYQIPKEFESGRRKRSRLIGYKILRKMPEHVFGKNVLYPPYLSTTSAGLKTKEWNVDSSNYHLEAHGNGRQYPSGYHIFDSMEDALSEEIVGTNECEVYKIQYRDVVAIGEEYGIIIVSEEMENVAIKKVIVAKQIKIIEKVEKRGKSRSKNNQKTVNTVEDTDG